ncbi:HAD family hydrolase [Streptomyces sp. NBC_01003]|uniref:HAD family hydrolase n=1 Tax=Streptomyces sp. NBC_01003 TaxID=2903714 RepID=UPI00386A51A6
MASADDVAAGKPAPDPVHQALELVGVAVTEAVFVGDRVWDMKAATRGGRTPIPGTPALRGPQHRPSRERGSHHY